MAKRSPKTFVITISLDAKKQNFVYTDLLSNNDARTLTVINGDQIVWILDPSIPERALQLDFATINPFANFHNGVTLRGQGQVSSVPVFVSPNYKGNRSMQYTVSLGNGLSDDPDVVPVENDGGLLQKSLLILATDFGLKWVDNSNYTAITVNPANLSKSAGGAATIPVVWRWAIGPNDPNPSFSVAFANNPNGWPTIPAQSTPDNPSVTLCLPPGQSTQFTVKTTACDGSNADVIQYGYLTITAQ